MDNSGGEADESSLFATEHSFPQVIIRAPSQLARDCALCLLGSLTTDSVLHHTGSALRLNGGITTPEPVQVLGAAAANQLQLVVSVVGIDKQIGTVTVMRIEVVR